MLLAWLLSGRISWSRSRHHAALVTTSLNAGVSYLDRCRSAGSGTVLGDGAAAAVLGSLFPMDAGELNRQAEEATEARLWAGIHFRSDLDAGLRLGRQVATATLDWAGVDRSD